MLHNAFIQVKFLIFKLDIILQIFEEVLTEKRWNFKIKGVFKDCSIFKDFSRPVRTMLYSEICKVTQSTAEISEQITKNIYWSTGNSQKLHHFPVY